MATKKSVEKTSQYDNQSIKALKGADRVRKRPGVIFGSDGLEGCEHSFFEILSNAVDEAREGHGDVITVTAFNDHSIEVDDHGRGVPLGFNQAEGRWNWDLIYCELYAGGKYDNNAGNSAYEYSLGLNGLGACATQYSSEYMEVRSFDGTHVHSICFKKGEPVTELQTQELTKNERRTGTVIRWRPDLEVFTDINIPHDFFVDVLHRQSVVNPGIRFVLKLQQPDNTFAEQDFLYENGISDYISELCGGSSLTEPVLWHLETQGRDRGDKDEYKLKADISFCISNTVSQLEYYHNSSYLEYGGSPDKAVKSAFVYSLDKYLKANGKYNKTEAKISFQDIADCLVLVINSFSTMTSYENQTKKSITNSFIADALNEFLRKNLDIYLIENPTAAEVFANQVLINKRSRESAESARLNIKKKLTGNMDIANRVEKFVNCRSKDPEKREVYIVEGDSALTSCKLGRDAEFQAIIPVRGKTLNCLKSSYEKIFKNEIIVDLLKVIGCGVEISGKVKGDLVAFDLNALRWSKIIICTDADEDGFQIRTLLLTMFYRLLPTLIREQKIFIAESPLFEITAKDKVYFAYNEFEKAEILKKLGNTKYTLQRSKGLGENEPEMMWQTTMNPATRRLISVSPSDAEHTARMFDVLLGDDLPARKAFIVEHGSEYIKDADI
ncbi:MAG: toprim domain-containing protein [Clostridia bacterium]|nr:toprim domain-containing protein [Clostridia bacterium]